jgi:hypothetical protein
VADDDALAKYEAELQAKFEAEFRARRNAEFQDKLARGWPPLLSRVELDRYRELARHHHGAEAQGLRLVESEAETSAPGSADAERRESAWPTQTMNSYTWATVQGAVRRYAHRNTRNEVADKTALTPADATRARRLYKHDLVRLNAQGKLEVDPRVRQKGNRIWLRYWDEKPGGWLDPTDSLP